jgi:16S rRNA (uracil1498-N3)-methyltransferase
MKESRYFYVPVAAEQKELPSDEAMHATRVLRLKEGDEIFLMDGEGSFFKAQITVAATHHCYYEILEQQPQQPQWEGRLHLAIAPTKMMERMEWLVEKATEVGVDEISFLDCTFSERKIVKLPRLDKIAVSAVKQSHKAWKPVLNDMETFKAFMENPRPGRKYIAHCYEEVPRVNLFDELRKPSEEKDVTVLIGPEGDFSIDEVKLAVANGYQSVDLGKSRLRTETAGLAAVMMMQLAQQG